MGACFPLWQCFALFCPLAVPSEKNRAIEHWMHSLGLLGLGLKYGSPPLELLVASQIWGILTY